MRFGDHVLVARTVVRVMTDRKEYFEASDDDSLSNAKGFTMQRSVGYRPLYRGVLGRDKRARYSQSTHDQGDGWTEWPGIPITEADAPRPRHPGVTDPKPYDLEPTGTHFVRFRRVDRITNGIVIGSVILQEGQVCEGSPAGYYGDGNDPPYFAQERRVPLVEVALLGDDKAIIVLAWHADLTVVDANATMTPHGAART